jgi:dTDP-4-dehydrorhamnose reductase
MKPRLLVTGACGLLGAHVMAAARHTYDVIGWDRNPWWGRLPATLVSGDLRDADFRRRAMADAHPDVVVHCAALVDVDGCERDPGAAYDMNGAVPGDLARLAGPDTTLVYISTDSVFRGDQPLMPETGLPCPRTTYARSKLHGEWNVQLAGTNHLIVRTNLYGWSSGAKRTFGEWLYGALERGEDITLFDDVFFTPIYVGHLATAILDLVRLRARGLVHVAGGERISKCEFGLMMAELAGLDTDHVTRGSIDAAGLAANRPKDMSLATSLVDGMRGRPSPSVAAGLRRFVAERRLALEDRFPAESVNGEK